MNEHMTRVSLRADDEAVRTEVARIASLAGVAVEFLWNDAPAQAAVLRLEQAPENGLAIRASFHPTYAPYFVEGTVTLRLPQEAEDLLELMLAAGSTRRGSVVGVIGAHGGAGASTLALWLSRVFAAHNSVALVDLDPGSAGIDLIAHIRGDPGLRWRDLDPEQGALVPGRLMAALAHLGNICVLSADERGGVRCNGDEGARAIAALSQVCDATVLDMSRHAALAESDEHRWISWCDALVVVCEAKATGIACCRSVLAELPERIPRIVVVRGARGKLQCAAFADDIGMPLALALRQVRTLDRDAAHGVRVGDRRQSRAARDVRAIALECQRMIGDEWGVR